MSGYALAGFMFASMIGLLFTGRQLFLVIGAVASIATVALWGTGGLDMLAFGSFSVIGWYVLLAIPMFIFMGMMLAYSGIADKLYHAFYVWSGRVNGGLAIGTVGLCSLIAAMSGLSFAATVTAGTISLPAMLKRKYDKSMVVGLIPALGSLGFLIPPSIVFIIYGLIASVSIGHLWIAGIIPGALLASLFVIYIAIRCKLNPRLGPAMPAQELMQYTLKDKLRALGVGIAPILLIFAVLGLLFMGVTSLIECASIGMLGAMIIAAINRRLNFDLVKMVMDETFKSSVMVIWIFMAALLFSSVFDGLGAIDAVAHLLSLAPGGNLGTIAIMQLSFFLLGMVMDDTAMLLIVAPLYIPLVAKMGYSLVWYGVLYVLNCQMAYVTPPFGWNLFIMKSIVPRDSGITMLDIYKSVIPYVAIQATALGLVIAFPQIALWLPRIIFPGSYGG
jgi:tripartite ATP-independent transporter DctM subunit